MKPELLNGLTLAYIGDAYYELIVRQYLITKGITNVNSLHKLAIDFTSGVNQAKYILRMIEDGFLTEKEYEIFKKGRNCHSNQNRKNISLDVYQKGTGFEALIGYLYLDNNQDRIFEIFNYIIGEMSNIEKRTN